MIYSFCTKPSGVILVLPNILRSDNQNFDISESLTYPIYACMAMQISVKYVLFTT
jgi:hypothetical protein